MRPALILAAALAIIAGLRAHVDTHRGPDWDDATGWSVLAALVDERGRLAAAVERVRAIHAPSPVFMRADECGHDPEDHDEIESITGAVLCWDSPTGEFYCTACGGDPIDELPAHPCATIRALDGRHE